MLKSPDRTNAHREVLCGVVRNAITQILVPRVAHGALTRTPVSVASKPIRRCVESTDLGLCIHSIQLILVRQEPIRQTTTGVSARHPYRLRRS